jgi:hypothetical protein
MKWLEIAPPTGVYIHHSNIIEDSSNYKIRIKNDGREIICIFNFYRVHPINYLWAAFLYYAYDILGEIISVANIFERFGRLQKYR